MMATVIDASTMRLLWNVVEEIGSHDLLSLNDSGLMRLVLEEVSHRVSLDSEARSSMVDYIRSKTGLIRDIAESRRIREC